MKWEEAISSYIHYLKLEQGLSENSVQAYSRDIKKLHEYVDIKGLYIGPEEIQRTHIEGFLAYLYDFGIAHNSQARIISGLRSFFSYLLLENKIQKDPIELIEAPKNIRKLPEVLSTDDIDRMISIIDHSQVEGSRNHAMIELLYSCGLRVSELTHLRFEDLFLEEDYIRITGKGNKQRFVPIGKTAQKYLKIYIEKVRQKQNPKKGEESYVFLNRRGAHLTREMIFMLIKKLAGLAGIQKKVSPHTFRHSFATHLVEGGANLRAVQEMLGHESITTTEIYTHLNTKFLQDAIEKYHPRNKF